jgi:hypothetical protein
MLEWDTVANVTVKRWEQMGGAIYQSRNERFITVTNKGSSKCVLDIQLLAVSVRLMQNSWTFIMHRVCTLFPASIMRQKANAPRNVLHQTNR